MHRPILATQPETVQTYPQPSLSGRKYMHEFKKKKGTSVSRRNLPTDDENEEILLLTSHAHVQLQRLANPAVFWKGIVDHRRARSAQLMCTSGVLLLRFGDGRLREFDASQEGHIKGAIALLPPPGRQSGQLRSSSHTTATTRTNKHM